MPYFDYNATTPLSPVARDAWLRASEQAWQNPSSAHRAGTRVKVLLQHARENLATVIGCDPDRIEFTSGATESVHAIARYLASTLPGDAKVAINPTEHLCVINAVKACFASERITWLQVDGEGRVRMPEVVSLIQSRQLGALWVMAANNETGVLQPWDQLAEQCRSANVQFVCDAAQWWGKIAGGGLSQADWVVAAGHKFGAPKRMSFLLRPKSADSFSAHPSGTDDRKQHGGTQDYPGVACLVAALIDAERNHVMLESDRERLRARFEVSLAQRLPGVKFLGAGAERLWNTVSVVMPQGENHRWVKLLDKRGFEVSTGSACSSGSENPSHVLAAMGVPGQDMRRVLRISASWSTTPADWEALVDALVAVAEDVKPADNVISI
ncbi:MAG: cysteine desulfurase family protein [Synoicihabitans sp.]